MVPKSSSLFHFSRSLENLKGVLLNGFYPRYCLEDTRWISVPFSAFAMVCFCDIPISRIDDHTAFYGSYGLGMTKEWGLKNGLVPVIYTPETGPVTSFLNYLIDDDDRYAGVKKSADLIGDHFVSIVSIIKPLSGQTIVGGTPVEKEFYQENEWRFVPKECIGVLQDEFDSKRDDLNKEAEKYRLQFVPQDVKYIFVKSEAEIPEVFDFIQTKLGHWPHNDIKILTSRIQSLDTLSKDM